MTFLIIFIIWDEVPLWLNNIDSFFSCLQSEFFMFLYYISKFQPAVSVRISCWCATQWHMLSHPCTSRRRDGVPCITRLPSIEAQLDRPYSSIPPESAAVLRRPHASPFSPPQLTHARASSSYIRSPWELKLNVPSAPAPDTGCFHS